MSTFRYSHFLVHFRIVDAVCITNMPFPLTLFHSFEHRLLSVVLFYTGCLRWEEEKNLFLEVTRRLDYSRLIVPRLFHVNGLLICWNLIFTWEEGRIQYCSHFFSFLIVLNLVKSIDLQLDLAVADTTIFMRVLQILPGVRFHTFA